MTDKTYEVTWLPFDKIPSAQYNDDADILYKNYGELAKFSDKELAVKFAFSVRPNSFLSEVFIFESPFECLDGEILQIWSVERKTVDGVFLGYYQLYDVGDGTPKFDGRSPGDRYLNVLQWCKSDSKESGRV